MTATNVELSHGTQGFVARYRDWCHAQVPPRLKNPGGAFSTERVS